MRIPVLVLLLVSLLPLPTRAQGLTRLRRAWRDPVDSVTVMPPYALDAGVTGLLVYIDYPHPPTRRVAACGYAFSWPFTSIDGTLGLYITRRQIYLQSGHNNPNPNYLYWVQDITPAQFRAISGVLGSWLVPLPFEAQPEPDCGYFRCLKFQPKPYSAASFDTDAQWETFRNQEEADLTRRVRNLLGELNYHLPTHGQLRLPGMQGLFNHGTHVAWSLDELLHGGPITVRTAAPKPDAVLTRNFKVQADATLGLGQHQYRLDRDYDLTGYTNQRTTRSLMLHWQRKAGASTKLPAQLTLHCRRVDQLRITPAEAGLPPTQDRQLWFVHLPHDSDDFELLLGLESGRTFHISCAEARLTATP